MNVDGVSMTLALNHLWEYGELFIFLFRLKSELPKRAVAENFGVYEGVPLDLPDDAALPETEFLATHRATIFRK